MNTFTSLPVRLFAVARQLVSCVLLICRYSNNEVFEMKINEDLDTIECEMDMAKNT